MKAKKSLLVCPLVFLLSSCFSLARGDNVFEKEAENIAKNKKAMLFLYEGDATVGESYHVIVCDHDRKPKADENGNAFIVDADHGATSLDRNSINFTWISNETLQIEYDRKLRIFLQESDVEGVAVSYLPK